MYKLCTNSETVTDMSALHGEYMLQAFWQLATTMIASRTQQSLNRLRKFQFKPFQSKNYSQNDHNTSLIHENNLTDVIFDHSCCNITTWYISSSINCIMSCTRLKHTSVSGTACWIDRDQTRIIFCRSFQQVCDHLSQEIQHHSIHL